jgi:hypothetical protein
MLRVHPFSKLFILFLFLQVILLTSQIFAQEVIWITKGGCGEPQADNHYQVGEEVYLNGSNFQPGFWNWYILGTASSCDPGAVVTSGNIIVDESGTFCIKAYTIAANDCGEYTVVKGTNRIPFYVDTTSQLEIVDITAESSWQESITWSIDKVANPTEIHMFTGDQGEVGYTVSVDKTAVQSPAVISGSVTVQYTGVTPVGFNLTITLKKDGSTIDQTVVTTLSPGGNYPFNFTLAAPLEGTYVVEAVATITNGTGDSDAESVGLTKQVTGYSAIHVVDGNRSWNFSDDGATSYSTIFTCDADEGEKSNTATITETGQSASADIEIYCYAPEVSKTADPAYTRTYLWDIQKSGDKTEDWVHIPQPFDPSAPPLMTPVNYTVVVDTLGHVDSNWRAFGTITVHNPAPIPAVIQNVADLISGVGSVPVAFPVSFPYTLAAGGTLTGTYSMDLPDAASRINTATATLVNYFHSVSGGQNAVIGTTDFTGSAGIAFGDPTTLVDECVNITDNLAGALGTVCVADVPKTFTYSQSFGPWTPDHCGESYERVNVATLTTMDTHTTKTSQWQVVIHVSCDEQQRQPLGVKADCIDPYVYKPTIRVHFIVTNPNDEPVEILHGINNALDPVAYQGMQPTLFAPGVTEWEVEIGRYEVLQWLLDGSVASASARTNICNYARQDDVYIAGVGVFYDTNKNGQYDAGEALLAPDFEGKIGEVYLLDQNGNTVDSRTLGAELFFRAGRDVNFSLRQIWGEYYLVPQLSVPLPAGYRIYPNYRLIHTAEFPEEFYSLNNDFGLVPADFVPDPLVNLDLPYTSALDWFLSNPVKPGVAKTVSEEIQFAAVPQVFVLNQNYPNPFNPQTTISYDLPEQALVTLTVYNVAGSIIAQLVNEQQEAGSYSQVWNAAQNPSGIYFYELRAGSYRQVKRMLLMK